MQFYQSPAGHFTPHFTAANKEFVNLVDQQQVIQAIPRVRFWKRGQKVFLLGGKKKHFSLNFSFFFSYFLIFVLLLLFFNLELVILMKSSWWLWGLVWQTSVPSPREGNRGNSRQREMWGPEMWLSRVSLTLSARALAALLWRQETARRPGSNLKAGVQCKKKKKKVENYPECQIRFWGKKKQKQTSDKTVIWNLLPQHPLTTSSWRKLLPYTITSGSQPQHPPPPTPPTPLKKTKKGCRCKKKLCFCETASRLGPSTACWQAAHALACLLDAHQRSTEAASKCFFSFFVSSFFFLSYIISV